MKESMIKAIEIMSNKIVEILKELNPSIYLYGSVALDDFKFGWSDIDIICLTNKKISAFQGERLLTLRQELAKEYENNQYYMSFEGTFQSLQGFLSNEQDTVVYWGTSGEKILNNYTLDPFSKIELIDNGVLLCGAEIRKNLIYPSKEEVFCAVLHHYETIRNYAVTTDGTLYSAGWLLDIARCLYTLKTGKIISKTKAGEWALENDLVPDAEIMQKVLDIRRQPSIYKERKEVIRWLEKLGTHVQSFADILEKELLRQKDSIM